MDQGYTKMDEINIKARAKINLALDVTGKRADGYHEVRMIMQSIGTYDDLTLRKLPVEGLKIRSNMAFLENTEKNLAAKAYDMMKERYGLPGGLLIKLQKTIPIAAGCAGGSSDAAAVIYGVNRLYGLGMTEDDMCALGLSLGADVPFCLMRGTMLSEGIGEKLTRLSPPPECTVLTAKPNLNVSTKWAYEKIDERPIEKHPDIDGMLMAIENRDLGGIVSCMGNVLETVTEKEYPVITAIKDKMKENRALGAMMSGSGPTVFGIYADQETARKAAGAIRRAHLASQIFVTYMYNPGEGARRN